MLSGQNQRLAALVLLYGLVEFQRDDFDEKRSMVYPKCLPTFASIFAKYVAKGTEKESHLLAQLICGHGRDIISKYSASQIIKNEAILPKNSSKKEALEKLKVRKLFIMESIDYISGLYLGRCIEDRGCKSIVFFYISLTDHAKC